MVRLHPAPLNQTSCLIFLCVPWFLINANQTSYLIFIYSLWFIFRHQMRLPYTLYLKPYTSYPGAVTSTPPSTRSCTPCATGRLFSADMQEGWLGGWVVNGYPNSYFCHSYSTKWSLIPKTDHALTIGDYFPQKNYLAASLLVGRMVTHSLFNSLVASMCGL